jgi:hypothetical protein
MTEDGGGLASSTGSDETKHVSNSSHGMPAELDTSKNLPQEDYFSYSCAILEALYNSDPSLPASPVACLRKSRPCVDNPPALPPPAPVQQYGIPSNAYLGPSSAAMAMALDQFPGASMTALPMPQAINVQQPMQQQHYGMREQFNNGTGYYPSNSSLSCEDLRLTDMSLSNFSIRQLIESTRESNAQPRGTLDSIFSAGTVDMFRQSLSQLNQIDQMDEDALYPSQHEIDAFMNRNNSTGEERISDMRFSDLSKDTVIRTRTSDSTKNTTDSGTGQSRDISDSDNDMAQLLLDFKSEKMEE